MSAIGPWFLSLFNETWRTSVKVLRIIVPVSIIIKIIDLLGLIDWAGKALDPVMKLIGLPGSFGLVWATTALGNIYSGMYVFLNYTQSQSFTKAEVTTLATMMLLAHSLPLELEVAKKVGAKRRLMIPIRVGSVFFAGYILVHFLSLFPYFLEKNIALLPAQTTPNNKDLWHWAGNQLVGYAVVVLIVFGILLMLRLLNYLGVIVFMQQKLKPMMAWLGLSTDILPMTIFGYLVGLVYGSALILKEKEDNPTIDKTQLIYAMVLLGLCHAIIEDTLLVMGLGASLWGILWFRMLYSFVFTYIFVKIYPFFSKNI